MSSSKDLQFCFICENQFSFSVSNNYQFGSDYSLREINSFSATFDTEKERRTELAQRFCTLASRYLNFDFNFNELKKNVKATARKSTGGVRETVTTRNSSKSKIGLDQEVDQCQCCPMCFPIVQSFCDFYEQWTHIQLKLDERTTRIADLMRLKLQSPKRSGQRQGQMGVFRANFLSSVSKGGVRGGHQQRYENIPKRSLQRIDSNTEDLDDDDDFEADTRSTNLEAFDSDRFSENANDDDGDNVTPGTSASSRRVIRIVRDGERNSAKTVTPKSGESAPAHFKCRFCGRMFTKKHKWLLQEHERMHTGERPFKCGICGKRFNRRAACRVHQRSAHGILKGEAEILKEVQSQTETDVALENNSNSQPEKKLLMPRFKCGICRKEFLHSFSCSRHLRIAHRIEKAEERRGKIRTFERNENDAEVDANLNISPVTLDFEVRNVEMAPYIKTEQPEDEDEDDEIQDGDDDADLDSNFDQALEVHGGDQNDPEFKPSRKQKKSPRKRQAGVTVYTCQYCGKRVFRKRDLENHERVHTRKKPFKCPKCEQTFAQKSGCKKHMIMKHNVAEEETLEMEIVPDELEAVDPVPSDSVEGTLKVKKIIRTRIDVNNAETDPLNNDLPLKCRFCGKGFKSKHNWLLKEHERIHTGERPFKCSICGKRYNRRAKCRYHQRVAHKGRGKVIGPDNDATNDDDVEVLTDQEETKKEKKFKCGVCGREFSQSFSCSRHLQTVHKIEKVKERQAMVVSLDSNKQLVVGKKSRPTKSEFDSEEDDDHDDEDDEDFDQMEVPAFPAIE